jgi:AcrR family transcriptional regulator
MSSMFPKAATDSLERRTQAQRRALSADAVIMAATKLVAEQGYTRTTLAEIGEAAGYSRGIVRERFGSKEQLFELVLARIRNVFDGLLSPAMDGRAGVEKILSFAESYLAAVERIPAEMSAIYRLRAEAAVGEVQFRKRFQEIDEWFRSIVRGGLEEGIASGDVSSLLDPNHAATLIVGMLRGTVLQWLMSPADVNPAAMHDSARSIILKIIRP